MEDTGVNTDIVHPEVRAHINSLVSALGGFSVDDDDGYKLGDDALEVLRDLKKWIRFYDEKTNRMDVARCLAEANIVSTDLLHILALWPPNDNDSKFKARIALACFEVIVPLTWPIEKDPETMTINHHRHLPVLQLAQLGYKRAIINFDAAQILSTAIRVALPSMAMPIRERTARDQGVIKLILYFLRNIALISPPPGVKYEGDETQISRSALIDAFSFQDVFLTLLTIASNMGDDFRTEDVIVLEIIFHLVKRVDSRTLFVSEKQLNKVKTDELTAAMNKEAAMLRSYNKKGPTRHSRFGTMIWVQKESGKKVTVSGQDALLDAATRERKMDSTKIFRAPRRARKADMEPKDLGPPVSLDERARQQLKSFVSEFLDSGFNPLFSHARASIDRDAPHVLSHHRSQFFYLVAWFLEAERMRRKAEKDQKKAPAEEDITSFNLVAEVLRQEMFVTMNRNMDRAYGDKDWPLLTTVMRCYTQVFLTVQEIADAGGEENEEIADNLLNRLFYEESTHDAIANIVRTYKDQGFEYLDAATELAHTFLRILESYSKQNTDLQVRSRKRTRKKKKAAKEAGEGDEEDKDDDEGDSADDERQAAKTSQERKFDFKRFAVRFIPQGVIDTFVEFTKFYRDLDDDQLKRAHRYFYRVAFKQEMSVMLFRLDIIHLFYNMIKGPEPLEKTSSMFKEWEELVKQILRRCIKKLEERPALFTELLFSKLNTTAYYLEYGHEKQTLTTSNPRPAAELEFKNKDLSREQQIAIAVNVLLDKNQTEFLEWLKKQLAEVETERRAWEGAQLAKRAEQQAAASADGSNENGDTQPEGLPPMASYTVIHPQTDETRTALFKNSHLRLLIKLVGLERLAPTLDETPDAVWVCPGHISADHLRESLDFINKAEFTPPTFAEGELAEDQLRRKPSAAASARRRRAAFDDDNDGVDGFLPDDDLDGDNMESIFAPGGPTARKSTAEETKRTRRKRQTAGSGSEDEGPDDAELAAKARARKRRELEKLRKIKSEMYVHASDDESDSDKDAAFFARELALQQARDKKLGQLERRDDIDVLLGGASEDELVSTQQDKQKKPKETNGRKRKSDAAALVVDDDDEDEEMANGTSDGSSEQAEDSDGASTPPAKTKARKRGARKRGAKRRKRDTEDEDEEMADGYTATPSSPPPTNGAKTPVGEDDDDDDDAPVVAKRAARPKVRAGFVMDSSDEE
ncbi:topoisomerase 1-associated factor 1 [Podospora australis]|uniref:Topoisomerase 1-associated factor 1 n=1 Tax=Podospora australis TaxID=1536484 RepID=A0AAN6WU46_9PEZI|nr:topoisomerase 1-associated factor 1 [Podospora australis]